MRAGTVCDLSVTRQGWSGPLAPGWEHSYYTFTDFGGFMAQLTPRFPGTPAEYARIARESFEDLAALNVIYAEVSVDGRVDQVGDDRAFWPMVEAIEEERRLAESRFPIRLNFHIGLMRTLPVEVAVYRVELAAQARDRGIAVVGIDLHGDEEKAPTRAFEPAYRLAREYGLGTRAHAGEAVGPESIWEAIDILEVKRIGHGVRALEDPTLVERLQRGDVTLEMNPTSNVRTGVVPDFSSHPVRRLYDLGVPVTVNSDDPLPFFTDIQREIRLLVDEMGFTRADLHQLARNAVRVACVSTDECSMLAGRIDAAYAGEPDRTQTAS